MSRRLNWHEIRAAYVEGGIVDAQRDAFSRTYPTQEEVATLYGVAVTSVRRRAGDERWLDLREAFQGEVEAQRRRSIIERRGDQSERLDDRGLSSAEAGLALVGMRLTWLIRRETVLPNGGARPEADRGVTVDARELTALGLAAKRFVDVKAQILGQSATSAEATVDELERELVVEDRRLAEELVAWIEQRQADEDADDLQDAV